MASKAVPGNTSTKDALGRLQAGQPEPVVDYLIMPSTSKVSQDPSKKVMYNEVIEYHYFKDSHKPSPSATAIADSEAVDGFVQMISNPRAGNVSMGRTGGGRLQPQTEQQIAKAVDALCMSMDREKKQLKNATLKLTKQQLKGIKSNLATVLDGHMSRLSHVGQEAGAHSAHLKKLARRAPVVDEAVPYLTNLKVLGYEAMGGAMAVSLKTT